MCSAKPGKSAANSPKSGKIPVQPQPEVSKPSNVTFSVSPGSAPSTYTGPAIGLTTSGSSVERSPTLDWAVSWPPMASRSLNSTQSPGAIVMAGRRALSQLRCCWCRWIVCALLLMSERHSDAEGSRAIADKSVRGTCQQCAVVVVGVVLMVVVHDRVSVGQVVHEQGCAPVAYIGAGPQRGEGLARRRQGRRIIGGRARIESRMQPLISGQVLIVPAHEGFVCERAELVFQPDGRGVGRNRIALADAVCPGDRIAAGHQRQRRIRSGEDGAARVGILGIARVGVAEGRFDGKRAGQLEIRLQ